MVRLKQALNELKILRSLTGTAIVSALGLILNQFTFAIGSILEIGFSFLAPAVSGFLYGPFLAGFAGVIVDILGYLLRPNGGFFIGFTLNEFLLGFIYGCFFYKKPVSLVRTFCACLTVVLVINLCLTPLWLHLMYGNALVLTSIRLIKNCIKLPIDTVLLYYLLKTLQRTQKLNTL